MSLIYRTYNQVSRPGHFVHISSLALAIIPLSEHLAHSSLIRVTFASLLHGIAVSHMNLYIGINVIVFYHQWRSLIGYATHYLFCCSKR